MRFWASISLALLTSAGTAAQTTALRKPVAGFRAAESRLAGLLPGQTRLPRAKALLGKPRDQDGQSGSLRWNRCSDDLVVEADSSGLIETIRITRHLSQQPAKGCAVAAAATKWATGRGLRLGDAQ